MTTWELTGGTRGGIEKLVLDENAAYRMRFHIEEYFAGKECFFPYVDVAFVVKRTDEHYHIPLLLSPFGYSTYRGS